MKMAYRLAKWKWHIVYKFYYFQRPLLYNDILKYTKLYQASSIYGQFKHMPKLQFDVGY